MKQNLAISVKKAPQNDGIISYRTVTVREKLLRFLLGSPQKLTVIVPGDTVEEIAIKEIGKGGNHYETLRN